MIFGLEQLAGRKRNIKKIPVYTLFFRRKEIDLYN